MKKQIFFLTSVVCATFFSSSAQVNSEKHTIIQTSTHTAKAAIHPAILANFSIAYPNATDATWVRHGNGCFVNFVSDDIRYNVFLNKKGKTVSMVRSYEPGKLSPAVYNLVNNYLRNSTGCSTIGLVQEVTTDAGMAYLVDVNSESGWKVLRIANNEIDVYQEHTRK